MRPVYNASDPTLAEGKESGGRVDSTGRLMVSLVGSGGNAASAITLLPAASSATGSAVAVTSGHYNWVAYGTWSGATAQLQWSPDAGTTWINFDDVLLTADGGWSDIPIATGHCRVLITGTPSLTSKLYGVA